MTTGTSLERGQKLADLIDGFVGACCYVEFKHCTRDIHIDIFTRLTRRLGCVLSMDIMEL